MPLLFQPKAQSVIMCDFGGFLVPEMIKVRPVVVISKHKHNKKLVTVIPLSTTKPTTMYGYHHELILNPLPDKPKVQCWAKCDMIYTVSLARLDRYKTVQKQYVVPELSDADFAAIQNCVAFALNLRHNSNVPARGL